MKKSNFCYAVLTASAVLALGSAVTAFAADWVAVGDEWVFEDSNGQRVTDSWKSSGADSYYLGSDGYMLRNTLLNDNENFYYLRSSGAMVKNEWRYIQNPEWQGDELVDEGSWYYFGDNGRAYKTADSKVKIAEIGGKKYAFDTYGRMMTGWVSETGEYVAEDNWQDGLYYADGEGDGSLVTNAWVYISVVDDDNEEESDPTYHFYFSSNGKKTVDDERKIGDKEYIFDNRGVAKHGWVSTEKNDKTEWQYYGDSEDPYLRTGWFEAVPDENLNAGGHSDGSTYWYYASSNGEIARGEFKTIDNKTYAFNGNGELVTGLKIVSFGEDENSKKPTGFSGFDYVSEMPTGKDDTRQVIYFGSDGAIQTGTQTIAIDGTNYSFYFKSNGSPKGAGHTGFSDGYIYDHGRRLTAEEDTTYQIVEWDGKSYVLNEKGSIQKKRKNIKDKDGYYYCTNADGTLLHGPLDDKCTE